MSLHTDALADLVRQSVEDSDATREDWHRALDQVFDVPETGPTWDNHLVEAVAEVLHDRDEPEAPAIVQWLHENESSDQVWSLLSRLVDDITAIVRAEGALP